VIGICGLMIDIQIIDHRFTDAWSLRRPAALAPSVARVAADTPRQAKRLPE
jgi:hypothetical protein